MNKEKIKNILISTNCWLMGFLKLIIAFNLAIILTFITIVILSAASMARDIKDRPSAFDLDSMSKYNIEMDGNSKDFGASKIKVTPQQ